MNSKCGPIFTIPGYEGISTSSPHHLELIQTLDEGSWPEVSKQPLQ